jgi:hypothetical protein
MSPVSRYMLIFMKEMKMYSKLKYCEGKKERNLHIVNDTYNPGNLPKRSSNMLKA